MATHAWFGELYSNASVDDLATSFTSHIVQAVDRMFPPKTVRVRPSDKPWITPDIKKLICDRQKAFHNHNVFLWQSLRRNVKSAISERKQSFYKNKVQHLKKEDS